jgi:hypothetical protein
LIESPFEKFKEMTSSITAARTNATLLCKSASSIMSTCTDKSGFFSTNGTLCSIAFDLSNIEGSIASMIELTDCSSVSPILRQLSFGSICTDSVAGLASLYSLLLVLTILGLVILSTRAALYNPVTRGRRNKRRDKEFENYKEYMSAFYDTSNWDINCIPEVSTVNSDAGESDCLCLETFTSGVPLNDGHEEASCIASESATYSIAPAISITEKSSVLDNPKPVAEADDDDDDDSYDSTYSIDAGEEQSVSSSSVFSMLMKRRVQALHQRENSMIGVDGSNRDEIVSKMSSGSSLIERFKRRNGRSYKKGSLSQLPIITTPHHPYDHRINSHDDDDEFSEENDENDSNVGVLLTPVALRQTMNLKYLTSSSQRKTNQLLQPIASNEEDEMSTSPLALELQPLSPSSFVSPSVVKQPYKSYFQSERFSSKEKSRGFRWLTFR